MLWDSRHVISILSYCVFDKTSNINRYMYNIHIYLPFVKDLPDKDILTIVFWITIVQFNYTAYFKEILSLDKVKKTFSQ